jgi:hypothetical protein
MTEILRKENPAENYLMGYPVCAEQTMPTASIYVF